MASVATTKLSSRGQVVIPEEIRRRLGLEAGVEISVVGQGYTVILKAVQAPAMRQFDTLIRAARKAAREAGMRRPAVARAVRKARRAR